MDDKELRLECIKQAVKVYGTKDSDPNHIREDVAVLVTDFFGFVNSRHSEITELREALQEATEKYVNAMIVPRTVDETVSKGVRGDKILEEPTVKRWVDLFDAG